MSESTVAEFTAPSLPQEIEDRLSLANTLTFMMGTLEKTAKRIGPAMPSVDNQTIQRMYGLFHLASQLIETVPDVSYVQTAFDEYNRYFTRHASDWSADGCATLTTLPEIEDYLGDMIHYFLTRFTPSGKVIGVARRLTRI